MADGYSRFGTGQHFYQSQHSTFPHGLHNRNGSPVSNNRGFFQPNNDTPSPNRSPGTHSPAHNPYGMFNHSSHRQNHGVLNGGAGQQGYQSQIGVPKGFQSQSYSHQGHISNQHQEHGAYGGHANAVGSHQHNASASHLTNATPHFAPTHLQNGAPENGSSLGNPPKEHWAEQLREHERLKLAAEKPHYYARAAPNVSRVPASTLSSVGQRTEAQEHGERQRVLPDEAEEAGEWDAMDLSGHGLRSMGGPIFRYYGNIKKLYFCHNKLSYLPPEIGRMHFLTFLDLSWNQLQELPPEIGMLTNLKKLLLFDNHLVDLPAEIGSLYQLEMLGVAGNPLRQDIKERLMEHGTRELVRFFREQAPEPEAPNDREWRVLVEASESEPDTFTVLSWNTLCDRGASQAQYGYTPSQALSWPHRQEVILDELKGRNADILTLQEIDVESYHEHFRPRLALLDYKGVFWPKNRASTMGEKEAKNVDGCATFFKNKKFVLLDKHLIIFSRVAINRPDMKGEDDVYNRVMPRDHIATVVFLENRQTGSRLIVVNTHLTWEQQFADVKVIQVAILMAELAKLANEYAKHPPCTDKEVYKYAAEDAVNGIEPEPQPEPAPSMTYEDGTQIPLLVCGDFNSTRDSGVYDLITQGNLSNAHVDLGEQKYGNFTRHGMDHPFHLKSAYANIGELPFTNYTPDFRGVIDYIWYSPNALQVTGLLGEVDPEYMSRVPGFPNWHFPSDHLSLLSAFAVKGRKERKKVDADFGSSSRREARS